MIVFGFHAPVGEIERARHHDADSEQRRRQRQQQAACGDRVGRHKDVSDKIDHQVEHLARPVRLHADDVSRRAIGPSSASITNAIPSQANIAAQCSRTASSCAISAMPAPNAVKICTEKAAARVLGDAGAGSC